MNMRGDNEEKRRGKTKQFRGKKQDYFAGDMRMSDFTWGQLNDCPVNLIHPYPIKGQWTYPKKGFIQWKTESN